MAHNRRGATSLRTIILLSPALLIALSPGFAQDQKPRDDSAFWEARQRQEAGAAAELVLARDPFTATVLRAFGFRLKVWHEPEFLGDRAPALNAAWLDALGDGTPAPKLRAKADDELRKDQRAYVKALSQALIFANGTPLDVFTKSAEENKDVTFAHLWRDPSSYRGKVIPLTGRLARVRVAPLPSEAREHGVTTVYEGWIFGPTRHSHPFWVLFTTLPDGLQVAEEMDRKVSFAGYFLKKIKYAAGDRSKHLEAPLLVGPTVTLVQVSEPPAATPVSVTAIITVVGVIVLAATGLVLIAWYFHRGDEAVKKRLATIQTGQEVPLLDDEKRESDAITKAEHKPPPPEQ